MERSVIMIVDDEADFVHAATERLKNRGIETISAFSGEECLMALQKNRSIDVIVLDVKMPGMDGTETLKEVKKIAPLTEVILLTGHATIESGIRGIELGAYDYLTKPCKFDELITKVKRAARKKRMHEGTNKDWEAFLKTSTLKELMVPIEEYATVFEDANVFEAVNALEEAQNAFHPNRYRHRAVLVIGSDKQVIGKLNQHNIIQALEPQYKKSKERSGRILGNLGFGQSFIESVSNIDLVDNPLNNLYQKAFEHRVKEFMHPPTEEECIEESASLDEAIHRLIIGKHQSLLVKSGSRTVGILRLTDVFEVLHIRLKALQIAARIERVDSLEKKVSVGSTMASNRDK
jgi:DNA-binding response OmpR family regulator